MKKKVLAKAPETDYILASNCNENMILIAEKVGQPIHILKKVHLVDRYHFQWIPFEKFSKVSTLSIDGFAYNTVFDAIEAFEKEGFIISELDSVNQLVSCLSLYF